MADSLNSTIRKLTLTAGGPAAQGNQMVYPQAAIAATVGLGINPDRPVVTGTVGPPFSVLPSLPAGMTLDPVNGTIAGTPAGTSPATTYTVTAANAAGLTSATVQIAVTTAGSGSYQILNCPEAFQEHSDWCGMACCSCILAYLGNPQSQCTLVNYAEGIGYACQGSEIDDFFWGDPIANINIPSCMGPLPSETGVLANFGFPTTGHYTALTFAEIQSEIAANRPFIILWAVPLTSGSSHLLVGMSWDTRNGGQEVYIMNPAPGMGIMKVSYDYACANDGFLFFGSIVGPYWWDRTITVNP